MRVWSISCRGEWLVIESGPDIAVIEGVRVAAFGTYDGGFYVSANSRGATQFKAAPAEAQRCVQLLLGVLSGEYRQKDS